VDGQGASQAIDFDYLLAYAAGDEALVAEVLGLFTTLAAQTVDELDPAGPAEAWRAAAHLLKGSALGVGARPLAELCAAAEQARDAGSEVKATLLAQVRAALDRVLAEIAAR
jgi:HPt (histidine-containing phosphotransfer) domain-containing protein